MKRNRALLVSPRTDRAGFTLTEIVLALAVIATVFIAILGLLPAGLNQSREAADSTVVAAILEDVHTRLQGQVLQTKTLPPSYFDEHGVFIPSTAAGSDQARRVYRADVRIAAWKTQPTGTKSLRPIIIEISSPVDAKTGVVIGKDNPKATVSYGATTLAGTDWAVIDTTYLPKIEY